MAAVLVVALGTFAVANQDAQSTIGDTGQADVAAANAVSANGGDVTENNVSSTANTEKWQGFWGTISGSFVLGDGTDVFFDWSGATFQAVYASPNNAPDWENIDPVETLGERQAADTEFGYNDADADSITETFSGNTCAAGTEIAAAAGVTPFDDAGAPGAWTTCIGNDGTAGVNGYVFGTNIVADTAFNNEAADYQLMVPAEAAGTDFYFFLEI